MTLTTSPLFVDTDQFEMPDEFDLAAFEARQEDVSHTVRIKNVKKAFGSFHVLTGLNINFADNAITTVLGPSGTGKSVLLKQYSGDIRRFSSRNHRSLVIRSYRLIGQSSRQTATAWQ